MRNKVFIASSKEKRESAEMIAGIIADQENCNLKPLPWYDRAFDPSEHYLEALTRIGKNVQGVIIILTKDDIVQRTPDDVRIKPRDNLVFECGLFLGMCGRHRTLIVKEEEVQIPTDLLGITCIPLRDKKYLQLDISNWCETLTTSSVNELPLLGKWIYYLKSDTFNAYGRFDIEKDRDEIKMVKGEAYYDLGPADASNLRGTWNSETVIIIDGDLKALYKMKILKKPQKEQAHEEYTGAFILHAIHHKSLLGLLKGRFSYLTEVDPYQGEIHALKIGELWDKVDERDSRLQELIREKIFLAFEKRKGQRRKGERRKAERRSQRNQITGEIRV